MAAASSGISTHEDLNSNNYFNNAARHARSRRAADNEFGGNLGGPMLPGNKAFFFVNWEEARVPNVVIVNQSVLTDEAAAACSAIAAPMAWSDAAICSQIARRTAFRPLKPIRIVADSSPPSQHRPTERRAQRDPNVYRRNLSFNEPQKAKSSSTTPRPASTIRSRRNCPSTARSTCSSSRHRRRAASPAISRPYSVFQNTWLIGSDVRQLHADADHADRVPLRTPAQQDTYNIGARRRPVRHRRPPHAAGRIAVPARDPGAESAADRIATTRSHQFYNNVTLVRGNHTITTGGSYRWIRWFDADYQGGGVLGVQPRRGRRRSGRQSVQRLDAAGHLRERHRHRPRSSVRSSRDASPASPDSAASIPIRCTGEDAKQLVRHDKQRVGGPWMQDSWRVNPSLTLNYGLRWQVSGAIYNDTTSTRVRRSRTCMDRRRRCSRRAS